MALKGDTESYQEWKEKSKVELKTKLEHNYIRRANKSVNIINAEMKRHFHNYSNLPLFQLSSAAIKHSLQAIFKKIERWNGVDSRFTRSQLKTFKEYFSRADNWWNRYKAEWIGDFFFYPLFNAHISEYIYQDIYSADCVICQQHSKYWTDCGDLLQFMIIKEMLNSEIKFKRAKKQPLLLDQCYSKSQLLQGFFSDTSRKHSVEWVLPPNVAGIKNYRKIIRQYAQNWIDRLIQHKLTTMGLNDIKCIDFAAHICNHPTQESVAPGTNIIPSQYCHCDCVHRCTSCNRVIPTSSNYSDPFFSSSTKPVIEASANHNNRPSATFRYSPYHQPIQHMYRPQIIAPTEHTNHVYNNYNYTPSRSVYDEQATFNPDWDTMTVNSLRAPFFSESSTYWG